MRGAHSSIADCSAAAEPITEQPLVASAPWTAFLQAENGCTPPRRCTVWRIAPFRWGLLCFGGVCSNACSPCKHNSLLKRVAVLL